MKIRNFLETVFAGILARLITVLVVFAVAVVITMVLMALVVTTTVVFELVLPLKLIAAMVGLATLAVVMLVIVFGKRR